MCIGARTDMCIDTCIYICRNKYMHMCTCMHRDMLVHAYVCMGVCVDVRESTDAWLS